jgi:hypothetical protein
MARVDPRQNDVTEEERREKRSGRQSQIREINDPRDQSRFLPQHPVKTFLYCKSRRAVYEARIRTV